MLLSDDMSDNHQGWDNMFWRKKQDDIYGDATTNGLIGSGVYTINRPDPAQEKKLFKRREHNLLSGVWYVFILSCLLWWLPPFGQMIAGYLGGRKAGSPVKGILVTMIPALIILLLILSMDVGLLPFLGVLAGVPNTVYYGIHGLSPNAALFLAGIYNSLMPVFGFQGSGFVVIVTFGLIGGIMADMNKKEIMHATGNMPLYDAFMNRFSGASLNKFADMVAERVIWTLGTIEHGGRKLMGSSYYEPTPMGFEDMKRLPPANRSRKVVLPKRRERIQPEDAFGYEDLHPIDEREVEIEESYPLISWDDPRRPQERRPEPRPIDDDFGISHRDMSEETMIKEWKQHKKKLDGGGKGQRYKRDIKSRSDRLGDSKGHEKRDAVIYDGKGKLIDDDTSQKKKKGPASLKKKQPALIERALAADKKISKTPEKEEPKELDIPKEPKEEVKPKRARQEQSYERL